MSTLPVIQCCRPLAAPSLSDAETESAAAVFKALGDPARVRILNLVATSDVPVCACNLLEPLGLAQPTVSHHLKKLTEAGLRLREQRGVWAYYSIEPETVAQLRALVELGEGSRDERPAA